MSSDDVIRLAMSRVGGMLLRMGVLVQTEMMRRVSQSAGPKRVKRKRATVAGRRGSQRTVYTTPSKPGEYLRTRTGHLRAGIAYAPTTPQAAAAEGKVRVGYTQAAKYGAFWERRADAQRRKGLIDLVSELAPQLAALARG